MKRWGALLLGLLLLLPLMAQGEAAYLNGDDLAALRPAYEIFVAQVADMVIKNGLLTEAEREEWMLYQLGDFLQNGGSGTIAVMYTPGLLALANNSLSALRMSAETSAGTLLLNTLRRYSPMFSSVPGLPLEAELVGHDGALRGCRFRWVASGGSLWIWNGITGELVDVGASYISDGRVLYWSAQPIDGIDETLTLELLDPTEDELLGVCTLTVVSGPDFWAPENLR